MLYHLQYNSDDNLFFPSSKHMAFRTFALRSNLHHYPLSIILSRESIIIYIFYFFGNTMAINLNYLEFHIPCVYLQGKTSIKKFGWNVTCEIIGSY